MPIAANMHLDLAELERAIQATDPSAFLVSARVLRRVIRQDRRLASIGLEVPHSKSYVIAREALRPMVDNAELGLKPNAPLPAFTILLVRPSAEQLAGESRDAVLIRYWRLLFHAHVHVALERRLRERKLTKAVIRQRLHRVGPTELNEVRAVLRQEHLLLPPRDDRSLYVEFVAVYLELRYFAPSLLPRYFPALQSYAQVDELLAADVDAARLLAGTRLSGAPDPSALAERTTEVAGTELAQTSVTTRPPSPTTFRKLMDRADRASAVGNLVRALILRTQAEAINDPAQAKEARAGAQSELDRLAQDWRGRLPLRENHPHPHPPSSRGRE